MTTEETKTTEEAPVSQKALSTIEAAMILEQRIGTVMQAVPVPKSELLHLTVSFGETIGTRNVLARIAKLFKPEELIGNQFLFATNLPPREMKGILSEAMIYVAKDGDTASLISPVKAVPSGTRIG